jgi:allophanate hydrolase
VSGPTVLEVISPGAYASLQDRGRFGYRRMGVPWAGVLDARLYRLALALAGEAVDAPVIECLDGGLHLCARGGPVRLAVAGDAELELIGATARQARESWCSLTLAEGEALRLRRLRHGRLAMVAIEGLRLPRVLGSAATYARAGLGGLDGRALRPGLQLPVVVASHGPERVLPQPPRSSTAPIRLLAGPQADHFTSAALEALVENPYRVTSEADRMGVRLEGPALAHTGAAEIVSDATVPGAIQVPGNGQPIVLLADAQTAGGYPKIGTVIGADLARVADAPPGSQLRFVWVDAPAAEQAAREAEAQTMALLASIRPLLAGGVDAGALYNSNLVSGVVDALGAAPPPAA